MSDSHLLEKYLNKVSKDTLIEDRMTKKLHHDSKACKKDENNGRNIKIFLSKSAEKTEKCKDTLAVLMIGVNFGFKPS